MIKGRYGDTSGRPYVEGRLFLPRFALHRHMSFLVDTGADRTVLMPADALTMGVDYAKLQGQEEVGGASGTTHMFAEDTILLFFDADTQTFYLYALQILVAPATPDLESTPSLLGRDVLDRWDMHYRPVDELLEFTTLSSDGLHSVANTKPI